MSQPADAPLMAAEKRFATSVVKRIFNKSPYDSGLSADTIPLPTAGQVIKIHGHTEHQNLYICTLQHFQFQPLTLGQVTKARVTTPDATSSTKRRRSGQLAGIRAMASGRAEAASAQLKTTMGLLCHKIKQGRRYRCFHSEK